jgi:hypothetical protein
MDCGTEHKLLFIRLPSSAGFQGIFRQDPARLSHMRNVIGSTGMGPLKSSHLDGSSAFHMHPLSHSRI